MKIVIIDERRGNIHGALLTDADLVIYIEPGNHARTVLPKVGTGSVNGDRADAVVVEVFDAVHRDDISAEISNEAKIKRIQKKDREEGKHAMPIEAKVAAGLSLTGGSGTEHITGNL